MQTEWVTVIVSSYTRQDGKTVRATQSGQILSVVAFDFMGKPVDNWDGAPKDCPKRFLPVEKKATKCANA